MGSMTSREKVLFYAIQENDEMLVSQILKDDPTAANMTLMKGVTNPICRATYNDHQSMVLMLLQAGANINSRTSTGRTPLHWAAFRGNIILVELLITKGAELEAEDSEGLNCFDLAVIRMHYETAFYLHKHHKMTRSEEERKALYAPLRKEEQGKGKMWREEFDVDLFFLYLESGHETIADRDIFFEKKRLEYQEWLAQDLVVDTRESWGEWLRRQTEFGEVPLVPRDELPEEYQPHASFYNKMANIANGIDPTPRGERSRRNGNQIQNSNDIEGQNRVSAKTKDFAANSVGDEEQKNVELQDVSSNAMVPVKDENDVEVIGFQDANQLIEEKAQIDKQRLEGEPHEFEDVALDEKEEEAKVERPDTALN